MDLLLQHIYQIILYVFRILWSLPPRWRGRDSELTNAQISCELRSHTGRRRFPHPQAQPGRASLHLHHLPVEILEEIFHLACVDGGATGSSLSQVSRRIRTISRASRFHSVSLLRGSYQNICGFLQCYERACEAAKDEGGAIPRIRHLCIVLSPLTPTSFSFDRPPQKLFDLRSWLDLTLLGQCCDEELWLRRRAEAIREYNAAVEAIFRLVSADLETLCLFGRKAWWEADITMPNVVCESLPKLRELSFTGDEPNFTFSLGGALRSPFPALERLYIVTDAYGRTDFERWVMDAPRLALVRVTCDSCLRIPTWMGSFRRAINQLDERTGCAPARIMLLIEPIPIPGSFAVPGWYHSVASSLYKHLQQSSIPLVFAPYYARQDVDNVLANWSHDSDELLRKNWLVRVSGNNGLFLEEAWSEFYSEKFLKRVRMRWLYGTHYLPPLIRNWADHCI